MITLPVFPRVEPVTNRQESILLGLAFTGSLVIHTPLSLLQSLLPYLFNNVTVVHISVMNSVRAVLFLCVTSALLAIIGKPLIAFFRGQRGQLPYRKLLQRTVITMAIVALLIVPSQLGIMGIGYAAFSVEPFSSTDHSYQLYQRLMMPALAYFLQFKDEVMFHFFSLVITGICIFGIQLFFETRKSPLSLLETVSLSTVCVVATQFQSPGYPESLVIVSALVMVTIPLNSFTRIAVALFALFVHESSALLFGAIALQYFTKEEKQLYAAAIFLYALCWIASFGFDIEQLLAVRNVGGMSGIDWLLAHPFREVLGIVASYKMLWMILIIALRYFPAHIKSFLVLLLPGIIASAIAVDTTRLLALSFLPFLFAMEYAKRYALLSSSRSVLLHGLNIIVPSVYVGLNSGIVFFNGIYQLLYQGFFFK